MERRGSPKAPPIAHARFSIGEVVRHRMFDFRGVIFDIDPVFANSEEWYQAIPEDIRPRQGPALLPSARRECGKLATSPMSASRICCPTTAGEPVDHPAIAGMFEGFDKGRYRLRPRAPALGHRCRSLG